MIRPPGMGGALFGEAGDGDWRRDDSVRSFRRAGAPERIAFAHQVHGTEVIVVDADGDQGDGDALVTTTPGLAVAVATADCVPVVVTGGGFAAVVHAGWRGAAAGVVEATLRTVADLGLHAERAAVGPAIGPCCYQVGPEVAARFPAHTGTTDAGDLSVDLPGAVAAALGELPVWRSGRCTFTDHRLNSFRRDGTDRRQVTVAWVAAPR